MKAKLNKQQTFEYVDALYKLLRRDAGVTDFYRLDCGCAGVKFDTGFKRVKRCALHPKHEYPRWCPCGKCEELSQRTAAFHRLGDDEAVDRLRSERLNHWRQCAPRHLVKDEYEGWTYPPKEEEIA